MDGFQHIILYSPPFWKQSERHTQAHPCPFVYTQLLGESLFLVNQEGEPVNTVNESMVNIDVKYQ